MSPESSPDSVKSFNELYVKFLTVSKRKESNSDIELLSKGENYAKYIKYSIDIDLYLNPYYISLDRKYQVGRPTASTYQNYRRFFGFHRLMDFHKTNGRMMRYIIFRLMNCYIMSKFLLIGTLQLMYERGIKSWRWKLQRTLEGESCYKEDDLTKWDIDERKRLTDIANWLTCLGSPAASASDTLTFGFYGLTLIYAVMYSFGYVLHTKRVIYIDWLTFIYCPEAELIRLDCEIKTVIQNIINENMLQSTSIDINNMVRRGSDYGPNVNSNEFKFKSVSNKQCSCKLKSYYRNQESFMRTFKKRKWAGLLMPENLTASTLKRSKRNQNIVLSVCYSYGIILGFSAAIAFYYNEFGSRIVERINELECNSINSTYIYRSLMLSNLDSKQEEIYSKYMNGTINWSSILEQVEYKTLFRFGSIQLFFEAAIIFTIIAFGAGIQFLFVFGGLFSSKLWLEQIQEQLLICTELLRRLPVVIDSKHESNLEASRIKVEDALTLTYINFMVFSKEHRNYRDYLQHFSTTLSCTLLVIFILCYIFGMGNPNRTLPYGWAVITQVVVLLNLVGRISGSLMQSIQRMFALINDVLAKSSQNNMELSYIVALWRRQIMNREEVQNFYGVRVLEIRLSYSNLVKFNSYVLGFFLYLMRMTSSYER